MNSNYSNVEDEAYSLRKLNILKSRFFKDTIATVTHSIDSNLIFDVKSEDKKISNLLKRNSKDLQFSEENNLIYIEDITRPINKDYISCARFLLSSRIYLKYKSFKLVIDCIEPKYLYKIICDYYNINTSVNTFYNASSKYISGMCKNLDIHTYDLCTSNKFIDRKFFKILEGYEQVCFNQHDNIIDWVYRDINRNSIDDVVGFNLSKKHDYLLRDELDIMFMMSAYGICKKFSYIENCELTKFGMYLIGKYRYKFFNHIGDIFPEFENIKDAYILVIPKMDFSNPCIEYHVFDRNVFCCLIRMSLTHKVKVMIYNESKVVDLIKSIYIVDNITCQIIDEDIASERDKLKDYYRQLNIDCDYFYSFRR